jgi:hypothetical protein
MPSDVVGLRGYPASSLDAITDASLGLSTAVSCPRPLIRPFRDCPACDLRTEVRRPYPALIRGLTPLPGRRSQTFWDGPPLPCFRGCIQCKPPSSSVTLRSTLPPLPRSRPSDRGPKTVPRFPARTYTASASKMTELLGRMTARVAARCGRTRGFLPISWGRTYRDGRPRPPFLMHILRCTDSYRHRPLMSGFVTSFPPKRS